MPAPSSMDVRRRFARLVEAGLSGRAAATRLLISPATGTRLARKVRTGEPLEPGRCGRRREGGKLGPHRAVVLEMVEADPDITMPELAGALEHATGVRADEASPGRALRRWGWRVNRSPSRRRSNADPISGRPARTG